MTFQTRFRRCFALGCGSVAMIFTVAAPCQAPAVATGDTRTVQEPSFPAACQVLKASFHDVNEDVPVSVEQASTSLDGVRLQQALASCTPGQAVELSTDAAGNNAFLTGPITIPTGVTLLVDPGVTLFFSRNAQDYDTTPGTHTCGTVNNASNTGSCRNLITMNGVANAGIMGYGKLNGRGGDVVLNSFPSSGFEGSTAGKTWWDLANDANTLGGSQQNPRMLQISNSHDITLYKITFKNAPNFHVALNGVQNFTVWGMHIVTPYSARNTDGIDPGSVTNATITQSWISDGDDNIALGANASQTANISVINNRFFAGHGESIGSITTYGVNNALFDNNTMYGDAEVDGSNSTAIRIKSANDRGGLVQNIQYSNSCFANHGTQMQFTPVYNTNAGTLTPNFRNILLQNLRFSNQGPTATGSFTFLGASNNGTVNPLAVTLDSVTVDTISSSNLVAPANAQITLGPGQVSANLASLLLPYNGQNGNTITDLRSRATIVPACNFLFLAPSLTGPQGGNQTVATGDYPTAVVILQPAFASASYPYPTGTVTVTDEAGRSFTATLPGTTDTIFIPITAAPQGVHTYTASYSGNSVYTAISSFGSFTATVGGAALPATSTMLSGVPSAATYGTPFSVTATVSGANNPSGSIVFLVNGSAYATVPLSSGQASLAIAQNTGVYSLAAVYLGDTANAGSTSSTYPLTVSAAASSVTLTSSSSSGLVGSPVTLTATVQSAAATPTGTVTFTYVTANSSTPNTIGTSTLINGVATYAALLPQGTDSVTATYNGNANLAASTSSPALVIAIASVPPVPASTAPVALPYTIATLVGGGASNASCAGHTDSFGDGCQGSAVVLPSGDDLRSVAADPFGNVYFTDSTAALVRKVSQNGVVTQFAGYISGTACVPTATAGCTPTLVKLGGKPRGIFADPLGNLFIAGYSDNKVYVVRTADNKMYLVAGSGSAPTNTTDPAGDGGTASGALLKGPRAVATDAAGNIFIADSGDNRIREVLVAGAALPGTATIQTVAGTGVAAETGDNGLATQATLNNPQGVAVDGSGNFYIAEGSRVRAVCVNCAPGSGLYDLLSKLGVTNAVNGNIYTVAGTGTSSNATLAPGLATSVGMAPQKIALDADGNLYIADSANNVIWFEDGRTGYTRVLVGGGTSTSCGTSTFGDGCAGTQAVIGSNGGNGLGVALDLQGNLYVSDSTNLRIRKVATGLRFGSLATGTQGTQTVKLHSQPGDTLTSPAPNSPDFTFSNPSCTTLSDSTQDCLYSVTFKPVVAGLREAAVAVNSSNGNDGFLTLAGIGLAGGATLDPARQIMFGQNLNPVSVALDPAGNVLVADAASRSVRRFAPGAGGVNGGANAASTSVGSFMNPVAVAADALGNVFVADASTDQVSKVSASGDITVFGPAFSTPRALAVDALNDVFVLDSGAKTIVEISPNGVGSRTVASGLIAPLGLALDAAGNVFVADTGVIYRIDGQTLARTTVSTAFTTPAALAVDAAGNLLIADSGTGSLSALPASPSSSSFTVASGLPANTLALDSLGNLYTASSGQGIAVLLRTQGLASYTGPSAGPSNVFLLSTGNVAASLSVNDPDTTNFKLAINAAPDCVGNGSSLTVAVGGLCTLNSSFTPAAAADYSNTVSLTGNAANAALAVPAGLQLVQMGSNAALPAQGTVQLIANTVLTSVAGGGWQATVTVRNAGTATAANAVLTGLTVAAASATPLPVALGSIVPGASVTATVSVPSSAGASGSTVVERVAGTYSGGSFGGSLRARLP